MKWILALIALVLAGGIALVVWLLKNFNVQ